MHIFSAAGNAVVLQAEHKGRGVPLRDREAQSLLGSFAIIFAEATA